MYRGYASLERNKGNALIPIRLTTAGYSLVRLTTAGAWVRLAAPSNGLAPNEGPAPSLEGPAPKGEALDSTVTSEGLGSMGAFGQRGLRARKICRMSGRSSEVRKEIDEEITFCRETLKDENFLWLSTNKTRLYALELL